MRGRERWSRSASTGVRPVTFPLGWQPALIVCNIIIEESRCLVHRGILMMDPARFALATIPVLVHTVSDLLVFDGRRDWRYSGLHGRARF